ncbi:hypothetical protein CCICO_04105 [Corynebacterium ciconiae DSM 44920]|uniref:hypothetical protein n=1 Tax=Corynebacterium ciconiae TaxID=227319 RepID=UPI00037BAD3E|nr:hypothetical protein [Corynebacterium ciconiae]WKD60858.1 hypothetical protein CCICO_04105 [Corynebacterium ciconiae DSM 44920]
MKWSHPEKYTYSQHSAGEIAVGVLWLSVGSIVSVLLEVVYLSTWITLPGGTKFPFPYTIVIAFFFTRALTRTARLWTENLLVAAIPASVWVLGYLILTFSVSVTGDMLVGSSVLSVVLLFAGIAGGLMPLFTPSPRPPRPEAHPTHP